MITLLLAISTGISAINWLGNNLAAGALTLYMVEKGYTPPTQKELRTYIKKEIKRKFPWYS